MNVRFSIIVPIYNVEKYLKKCIESILSQTYTDFELILVDDGSNDNCPRICDDYAKHDKRVEVIHKKNAGLVAARNTGIMKAKGQYICYVDGDDWIESNLLEYVNKKAIEKYDCDIVLYGAKRVYDGYEEEIPAGSEEGYYSKNRLEEEIYPYMIYDNRKPFFSGLIFPVAWNKIYRRDLLLEHYCKDERIKMGEDNAFVYECLYSAQSAFFLNDVLYCYNQMNTNSMIHTYDEKRFINNQYLTNYISEHMGGNSKIIDKQLNAFKAYWLIMAVFHEVKCNRKLLNSAKHIKQNINDLNVLDGIYEKELPKAAFLFVIMLKLHMYFLALLGAKIVNKFRNL